MEVLSVYFTPLATGHGTINGAFQCYVYNQDSNPTAGTLHKTWVTWRYYFDGVLLHTVKRNINSWEPGSANAFTIPFTIPWSMGWAGQVGVQHHVQLHLSNYRNAEEEFVGTYPMGVMIEDSRLMIDEDPEPGIGTNSSYLMAGAVGGVAVAGQVAGSWVAVYTFTLPGGLGGSWARSKTAATGQVDFDIQVNGVSKGSIRWANGATIAGFNFPTLVTINVGDLVEVYGAAGVTDPTWTLRGLL
jgi:hypothetical protein